MKEYRRREEKLKLFHTADWHLGKLVHGVHMTDDQRYVLTQFVNAIREEKPDAVMIAGDLYDRAVPPTEAVALLDEIIDEIVVKLQTPVFAIAGNHDSPGRLHFGSRLMKENGYYIGGHVQPADQPIILNDEYGEVHFHLLPYADPSIIRTIFEDTSITNHQQAMQRLVSEIEERLDPTARHILIGHAFVTAYGDEAPNTSDAERPLAIGGAEYVSSQLFSSFHYTALGHLHQAHKVGKEQIRYAGSPLKYSISEEHHEKGFLVVELDAHGQVTVEKRLLEPVRDMRTVEGKLEELLQLPVNDDYVFVRLLDEVPILFPMEKIRSVFPNAMHIERKLPSSLKRKEWSAQRVKGSRDAQALFEAFYEEVTQKEADEQTVQLFKEVFHEVMQAGGEGEK